jgi:hypothetical protein
MQVSFDDGGTWHETAKFGANPGCSTYVTFEDIPAGTRRALVRYHSTRMRNTLCLFDVRIDADYALPGDGFRPVKVTYLWEEGGQPKTDVHVARRPSEAWTITCGSRPVMRSFIVELAE